MNFFIKTMWPYVTIMTTYFTAVFACHGQLLVSGVTEEDKQIILQEHNRLRQMVATGRYPGQPGAENMREIVWDDELAARAQKWADNCQFRHDPHRTINRFTMGQNLAIIWSTAPLDPNDGDFPSRIQSWFNEVQKYSFGDAWSPKTGHYSQLVWGETSLVGCGYSEYKDNIKYNKLYVCNYGPGGNVVGYNPYEVGKPACASYGMKPSSRYHGLCAAPNVDSNNIAVNSIETYAIQASNNNAYTNNNQNNNIIKKNNNNKIYNTNYNKNIVFSNTSHKQKLTILNTNPVNSFQTLSSSFSKFHQQALTTLSQRQISETKASSGSFGNLSSSGSYKQSTETNKYKYKTKLESYRPSSAEFERSVLKHTILRSYLNQNQPQTQLQTQQQPFQQQFTQQQESQSQHQLRPQFTTLEIIGDTVSTESPLITSTKPPSRGWSLLTWRG